MKEARQNSNADRYELASAPEHPVAPEEDEGEGEVDFSQYDIFGNNADDEFESEVNSEEEFAYAIPKIFEDDDKFGDETHKSIAALVNAVTNRKSVITEIAKDYKVPSNSKSLAPPKVNPEIWHLLNRQARSDDLSFQTIQRILGFGIVPVIRTAEALTKPDAVKTVAKMRVNINNALSMLCAAFFEISYVRRMTLKNNMDQKYHQLCTRHLDVTEYLFGDDVSKKVKDINDAQKMKGVVNTATSKNWRQGGCSYGCPPGFLVNKEKSVFIPTQRIIFLGYLIDSVQFKVFLTEEKNTKDFEKCKKIYSLYNPVIRESPDQADAAGSIPIPHSSPQPITSDLKQASPSSSLSPGRSPISSPSLMRTLSGGADSLPVSLEKQIKIRKGNDQLGLTVESTDKGINGCHVKSIATNSAVGKDGRIKVGDYIVNVNNESTRKITNAQVRAIIRRASLLGFDISITYISSEDAAAYKSSRVDDTSPPPPTMMPSPNANLSPLAQPKNEINSPVKIEAAEKLKTAEVTRLGQQTWGPPRTIELYRQPDKSLGISIVGELKIFTLPEIQK
ncbi:MPDZ [Mytilus edulis]|uniref:MPDZ n=1 Tax=Mytilus edulis TaxID=6550 RepID=A0A8S3USG6_MYTED|nr:MPDZ [Mytilus edulis]